MITIRFLRVRSILLSAIYHWAYSSIHFFLQLYANLHFTEPSADAVANSNDVAVENQSTTNGEDSKSKEDGAEQAPESKDE